VIPLKTACASNPLTASLKCVASNVKGVLSGGLRIQAMKGLVDLEGMEGVTSTGVNKGGHSMELNANPILTSTCALTNTKYLTTLFIGSNPKLVVCPLSTMARAADVSGVTIMHNTTCPSAGVLGSTGGITIIVIGTLVAPVCVVGFLHI
jgi:hypothetical protein